MSKHFITSSGEVLSEQSEEESNYMSVSFSFLLELQRYVVDCLMGEKA